MTDFYERISKVQRGARHLVLLGRRGPNPEARLVLAELKQAGATVVTQQADVACEEQVARVLTGIEQGGMPPLAGIFHSAAVLDDGILLQQDAARFRRSLTPKVAGSWNLHRLSCGRQLDFFVLFSSAAAILGSRGQSNYAAANAFLDALAHHRLSSGLPAVSINWGPWTVGLAAALNNRSQQRLLKQGVQFISAEQGLGILGRVLATPTPQVVVLPVDWAKLGRLPGEEGSLPLVSDLLGAAVSDGAEPDAKKPRPRALREQLADAAAEERQRLVLGHVRAEVARILGLDPSGPVDEERGLFDMGMDSLMSVDLRRRLEASVDQSLPSTLTFNYPTIQALSTYLATAVLGFHAAPKAAPEPLPPTNPMPLRHADLSEEDLEARLAAKLAQIRPPTGSASTRTQPLANSL